jgi:hypothetical protein
VEVASIPGRKVGEECWNFGLDGWLEVVMATSEAAQLQKTLPMASQVLDPHENPVT